jgi:hypothetical protein
MLRRVLPVVVEVEVSAVVVVVVVEAGVEVGAVVEGAPLAASAAMASRSAWICGGRGKKYLVECLQSNGQQFAEQESRGICYHMLMVIM